MTEKQHFIQNEFTPEQVYENLSEGLYSTRINDIQLNPNTRRTVISASYYNYELTVRGNQLTITPKTSQKLVILLLVFGVTGFFFLIPFIGMIVILILAHMEGKELTAQILQLLDTPKT